MDPPCVVETHSAVGVMCAEDYCSLSYESRSSSQSKAKHKESTSYLPVSRRGAGRALQARQAPARGAGGATPPPARDTSAATSAAEHQRPSIATSHTLHRTVQQTTTSANGI